jgi:hypothetical protein
MPKSVAVTILLALAATALGAARAQSPQADPRSSPAGRAAPPVEVKVRMMRADEVAGRRGDSLLPPEAVGLFLVPQAVLTPTASDAVTAAVVGPPGGVDFEVPARTVLTQLSEPGFAAAFEARIRELMAAAPLETGDAWRFDVAIAYHGLRSEEWRPGVQSESASYCLVTGGSVEVSGLHGPLDTSPFQRGVDARSDGMPDPECRTLTEFAANGGRTLRQATRDTAAVLAAWIVNRSLQDR